jgi:hypothetical protein
LAEQAAALHALWQPVWAIAGVERRKTLSSSITETASLIVHMPLFSLCSLRFNTTFSTVPH